MKSSVCCFQFAVCLALATHGEAANPPSSLRIGVYESEANAGEYRGVHQSPLRAWLQRNHYDFEVIGDRVASDPGMLARFTAVVSTSNYIVPDTAGTGLAAFVKAGGRLLWIDGPARCHNRELLTVLGIKEGCTYTPVNQAAFHIRGADHLICLDLTDFQAACIGNPALKATGQVLVESSAAPTVQPSPAEDERHVLPAVVVTKSGSGVAVLLNWIVWLSNAPEVQSLLANTLEYLLAGAVLSADPCVIRPMQVPDEVHQPTQIPVRLSVIARPAWADKTAVLTARLTDAQGIVAGPTAEVRVTLKAVGNDVAFSRLGFTFGIPDREDRDCYLVVEGLVDGVSVKPLRVPLALNGRAAARLAAAQAERGRLLRPAFAGLHGDYDAEPRTKDGRVDIDRLFRQIEAAHLDMYDFLIWHAQTDWDDFQVFLAEAQRRRLKVWVTLVPPSEPPASGPFGLDYLRWADEIGRLSKRYDNLIALVIDDFWSDDNRSLFTPSYIARLVETLRGHNPKLAFLPTLYWNTIGDADFIKSYGSLMDGIVFPYADLESAESLPRQLAACRKWLGPDKVLLINVYASGSSGNKEPGPRSPKYLRDILEISRQACDGIRLYCLPKDNFDDSRFRIVSELFGKWNSQETNGQN